MRGSTKTLCWCLFFMLSSVTAQKSEKTKRCTTTPTLFKNIGKIVNQCEADVRVLLIDDVFNFANESLPSDFPDDFEFNLNEPRPYRPKLKKYLQYDAHGDDTEEYSSHRFVIKNYRNKLKDYHPANMHSSMASDEDDEEVLDTQPTRHKPSIYRRPVYMEEDLQESDYRDSVPHESLMNLKSIFKNGVNQPMKGMEPESMSHQSMYQVMGPHMPVKMNSIKQFPLEVGQQGQMKPMSVQYDAAPETPIFHQPTQTYLHMPQEQHIQAHGHEFQHFQAHGQEHQHQPVYEFLGDPHHHQQHYEMKHYHPQSYVHQGAHLIPQHNLQLESAQSAFHPVVHPQPQTHLVSRVPFLAQHQVVHQPPQPQGHSVLDAHTVLAPVHPPSVVHGHVQHGSVAGPPVVVPAAGPPLKFKKSKKRKVVKLRVRLNKKRKPHYVQKLYPVDSNHLDHHEVQESRPPVVVYRPRSATRQFSQGLVTRLHKVQPYEKKRVKRDNSVDLFTHQSIVSKEDRWVAGCLMHCVYGKNKVLDKNGWPTLDGLIKLFSEGVQEYGYFTVTLRAVDTCLRGTLKKHSVDTSRKATTAEGCDIAFDLFDCVTDMIADYCK